MAQISSCYGCGVDQQLYLRFNYAWELPYASNAVLKTKQKKKLEEEEQAKDLDVILIDRSLFDRIIWVDRLYLKNGMKEDEYKDYLNTYIPLVNEKIDISYSYIT